MKFDTTTLLIIGVAGLAGWYFLVKKPADEKAAAPPAGGPVSGAPAGSGLTETQQVLTGTAGIIDASGTALGNVLGQIWPN